MGDLFNKYAKQAPSGPLTPEEARYYVTKAYAKQAPSGPLTPEEARYYVTKAIRGGYTQLPSDTPREDMARRLDVFESFAHAKLKNRKGLNSVFPYFFLVDWALAFAEGREVEKAKKEGGLKDLLPFLYVYLVARYPSPAPSTSDLYPVLATDEKQLEFILRPLRLSSTSPPRWLFHRGKLWAFNAYHDGQLKDIAVANTGVLRAPSASFVRPVELEDVTGDTALLVQQAQGQARAIALEEVKRRRW